MKKNIAIVTSLTVPSKAGGGLNAFNLARTFAKQGYNVKLLTFNWGLKWPARSTLDGVKIVRGPFLYHHLITKLLSLVFSIPIFIKHIFSSDLVIIFGPMMGHEALIVFGSLFNKKIVYRSTMLNKDDIESLINHNWLTKLVRKKVYDLLTGYIAINPSFKSIYESIYGNDDRVLSSPQGVDTEKFHPLNEKEKALLRTKLNLPKEKLILITIGHLIKRKGYEELFDFLKGVPIDFYLIVIGDYTGQNSERLFKLQNEMSELYHLGKKNLGDKIKFIGERDNVEEYLQASDIFILNSNQEGLPNVLLEAMATGRCVIVREIEGVNNYISFHKKNALIFKSKNEFLISFESAVSSKSIRDTLGKNAHEFIEKDISISTVSRKIINKFSH